MLKAQSVFNANIVDAKDLSGLYDYLSATHNVPFSFDDLLRSQVVYVVSAFDKLMHDIIRVGMLATFTGQRPATAKYHAENISIGFHSTLVTASVPPKERLFEDEVSRKLSHLSFQDPDKLAEGLSLIWHEKQKWQAIGAGLALPGSVARTQLKLIAMRRNAIVHESDMQPITNEKQPISRAECTSITDFVHNCGNVIVGLVI